MDPAASRPLTRSRTRVVLPWDVLDIILHFVTDKNDLSAIMKTCKELYRIAIPLLSREVVLHGRNINSFCMFMLSKMEPTDRPALLNSLAVPEYSHFSYDPHQPYGGLAKVATQLVRILSLARNLVDRKSTRLNSSHSGESRMPSSA